MFGALLAGPPRPLCRALAFADSALGAGLEDFHLVFIICVVSLIPAESLGAVLLLC